MQANDRVDQRVLEGVSIHLWSRHKNKKTPIHNEHPQCPCKASKVQMQMLGAAQIDLAEAAMLILA